MGHVAGSHVQDIYPPAVQVLWKSADDLTEIVHFQKTPITKTFLKNHSENTIKLMSDSAGHWVLQATATNTSQKIKA